MHAHENNASGRSTTATPIAVHPRRKFGVIGALRATVIASVMFAMLGVEVTLRIAPQLGIIGNVAAVWLLWGWLTRSPAPT